MEYRVQYKQTVNFGLALEKFANRNEIEGCLDGIKSLFSFHRQRMETWYYMISCLKNFIGHPLYKTLVIILCHIPGHEDICWHNDNAITCSVKKYATNFIRECFQRDDIVALLGAIDDFGIERGSFGQCVHAIIDVLRDKVQILESIAFDYQISSEARYSALLLLLYYKQQISSSKAIEYIYMYLEKFGYDTYVSDILETMKDHGFIDIY
jgi:hypothetical protein